MKLPGVSAVSPAQMVVVQRSLQAATGLVTTVLVMTCLSPAEQGYFFAMGSLLSSYILLDLGLSGLLVQLSARRFVGLAWREDGGIGPAGAASGFMALVRGAMRWYGLTALAAVALMLPLGFLYFWVSPHPPGIEWRGPWLAIVLAVALNMPALGVLALLEGTGQIRLTYLLRALHYLIGAGLAWVMLLSGHGLYAQAMPLLAVALVGGWWGLRCAARLPRAHDHPPAPLAWRQEIWPQQKRAAVTWLSTYLFLNIPTLLVFAADQAVAAGQLGMSMALANILGGVTFASITAIVPQMTQLIASGQAAEGRRLFRQSLLRGTSYFLALGLGLTGTIMLIQGSPLAARILPPLQCLALLGVFAGFHVGNCLVVYYRAHEREPLALPSLLCAVSIALIGAWVVPRGIWAMLASMALGVTLMFGVFWRARLKTASTRAC